jgi:hypothetical protein
MSAIDDTKPWFRFAAESVAPRRVHLAKAVIVSRGKSGWDRELEIDGHEVSHRDPGWPAGIQGPDVGYITRFAVFEFPRNSSEMARRAKVERTVRYFAEHFSDYGSVNRLMEEMVHQGFAPELVHEAESISTIAFGRVFFEPRGIHFSPTVIRARRDGRVEAGVPLMSIPAYTRARAVAVQLRETMPEKDYQTLCLYNAESNAILKALEAAGGEIDFSKTRMYPSVVPDWGVSDKTMDGAIAFLNDIVERQRGERSQGTATARSDTQPQNSVGRNRPARKKPWWKFW